MWGSATFTMVVSSTTIICAASMTIRNAEGRSRNRRNAPIRGRGAA